MEDAAAKGEPSEEFDLGGPNAITVAYNPVRRGEAGRSNNIQCESIARCVALYIHSRARAAPRPPRSAAA